LKLFVTGGAGFIGSHFVRQYLDAHPEDEVIVFDALTYAGNLENLMDVVDHPGYSFIKGDICDAARVQDVLPEACDAVVHFAAESHVDRSILSATEFIQTNVLGTQVLLDVARHKKVGRFLHISTDEVGGDLEDNEFFREDGHLNPSSPYAASKTAAEHLVRAATRTFGVDTVITRTSNNYGPNQFPEKLLPLAISNAMAGKPIPVYGDGLQVRDWIHVRDNCSALDLVLHKAAPGSTYHIGGRSPLPNLEVLRTLLRVVGASESLLTPVKDRPGHDRRYAVDCSKIEQDLGWTPAVRFEDGLRETVQWYKDNAGWVERARSGEYRDFYKRLYGAEMASA
jgi:dTDP-glucose 4,6-dehydratase